MKKELIRLGIAAALVGVLSSDIEKQKQSLSAHPTEIASSVSFGLEGVVLDTASFYCERTKCHKTPEEMAINVFFVGTEDFTRHLEGELGHKLGEKERRQEEMTRLEITTGQGQIFINERLFEEVLRRPQDYLPLEATRRVIAESLLIHAFSHVNSTKQEYKFSPFSLRIGRIGVPELGTLRGFKLVGRQEDGRPYYLTGADEAITEFTARIIGKEGRYISLVKNYSDGGDLIEQLNKRAGISSWEFLQYANGNFPQQKLLQRWGALKNHSSPDEKAAVMALAVIGLRAEGIFNKIQAVKAIEEILPSQAGTL